MTDDEDLLRYEAFEAQDQLAYVMGYEDYDDLIHDLAKGKLKGSRLQEWNDRGNLVCWEKWKRYKARRKAIERVEKEGIKMTKKGIYYELYDDDDYEVEWYKDYRFQVVDRTGFIFHQSADKAECERWIVDHGDWSHEGSFMITNRETWCGRRIHKKGDFQLRLF